MNIISIYLSQNFGSASILENAKIFNNQNFDYEMNYSDSLFIDSEFFLNSNFDSDYFNDPLFLFFNEKDFKNNSKIIIKTNDFESPESDKLKKFGKLTSSIAKFNKENSQASLISEMIESIIFKNDGNIIKPDVIIANSGPSSFTEIRILLSAAKAFSISFPNSVAFSPTIFDLILFASISSLSKKEYYLKNLENEKILIMTESFKNGVYLSAYEKYYSLNDSKFFFKNFIFPKFIDKKELSVFFTENKFRYVLTKINNKEIFDEMKNLILERNNENNSDENKIIWKDFSNENFSIHGINFWNKLTSLKIKKTYSENLKKMESKSKKFKPFYVSTPEYKKLK